MGRRLRSYNYRADLGTAAVAKISYSGSGSATADLKLGSLLNGR